MKPSPSPSPSRPPPPSGPPSPAPAARTDAPVLLRTMTAGVARLTLNRPRQRNCLSEELLAALQDSLDALAADDAARVIVLAAAGPVFCSGHDLLQMSAMRGGDDGGRARFRSIMERCSAVMQTIVRSPKPVIAQVQGTASAAGCQLVASCDLAVAAATAHFVTPGVNIGLFCSTPMVALSRGVLRKHAMEMLLLGEDMDAATAVRFGLINAQTPPAALEDTVMRWAARIAAKPARTVRIGKQAFQQQLEMPLEQAYAHAADVMVANMLFGEAQEGISAFLDKRPPSWETK